MSDPAVEHEIATLVREAIARHGMAGDVVVRGASVVLEGHGRTVSTELGLLGEQWTILPHDVQARRAAEMARRLADARRALSSRPPSRSGLGVGWLGPAALVALLGAGVWGALRFSGTRAAFEALASSSTSAAPALSSPADAYEAARRSRAAAVCARTRERVLRGASISMTDADGWIVELVLLRDASAAAIRSDPALGTFLAFDPTHETARLVWAGTPALAAIDDAFSRVRLVEAPALETAHLNGVSFDFGGAYVTAYFDSERRGSYSRLAGALAERLGASHGALFARCADRDTHEIGSWFRAPTPAAAAGVLMFFMGTYADVPQVRTALLRPADAASGIDRGFAFTELERAAASVKYEPIRALLGDFGGAIAGRPEGPTTLTFDFKDASRASRASYRLARDLDVADSR